MKKALITGINGFVGGYLSEYLLLQGIEVYGTYYGMHGEKPSGCHLWFEVDLRNKCEIDEVINKVCPDFVFHLAAQSSAHISWKEPVLTHDINVGGTINLLDSLRGYAPQSKVLLIGSSEEYGFVAKEDNPVNEQQALKPGNPYAVSKIAQNYMGQVYARAYNMHIVMARAFNHIGPKQTPVFVVADFAKRIAEIEAGLVEPILMVGNLDAIRDFTDVRDMVQAYYQLLCHGVSGETYNIGSGQPYAVQTILDILLELSGVKIEVRQDPNKLRPSDLPLIYCDKQKLDTVVSWKPEISVNQTLVDILNYWRNQVSL